MSRLFTLCCLFFFPLYASYAQCPGSALTINTTATAATCPSNGTITATAGGGVTPYQYSITAGPVTRPSQSGNAFSSLPPGSYTVRVSDNCGNAVTRNTTVTNSYTAITISSISGTPNYCPVNPDGTATINAVGGSGTKQYEILSGATVVAGPQASASFTGLADGNYTARVTDACGEIRTLSFTLTLVDYVWGNNTNSDNGLFNTGYGAGVAASPFPSTELQNFYVGPVMFTCDSVTARLQNNIIPAHTTKMRRVYIRRLSDGVIIQDVTYRPYDYPSQIGPSIHFKINENYRLYFDDLCNNVDSVDRNYSYENTLYLTLSSNASRTTCNSYRLNMGFPDNWNKKNTYNSDTATITITSSTLAGDTMVGKRAILNYVGPAGTLSGALYFDGVTPGNTYTVSVATRCTTYTRTVILNPPPPFNFTTGTPSGGCNINLSSMVLNMSGYPAGNVATDSFTCVLNSGPTSYTNPDGGTYTVTYPISYKYVVNQYLPIRNIPAGTYSVTVSNWCGESVTKSFTITAPQNVSNIWDTVVTVTQACPGSASASISFKNNLMGSGRVELYRKNASGVYTILTASPQYNSYPSPYSYTFSNLSAGEYKFAVTSGINANDRTTIFNACDTFYVKDFTIDYKVPALAPTSRGFVCTSGGSDGKVELHTQYGVGPFTFERLTIPGNAVVTSQSDSTFTGLPAGTYRFRVTDNCGNAVVQDISISTLSNPAIGISNTGCVGGTVKLFSPALYPGAAYSWTGPAGPYPATDTLTLNPVTPADFGTYTLTQTIPGCGSTYTTTFNLKPNCILPVSLKDFNAKVENCKVSLSWEAAVEQGFSKYDLEYSNDGVSFKTIAVINGQGNNSQYHYLHQPQPGKAFYRLRMIDADARVTYSRILFLNISCTAVTPVTVYPNPVKDKAIVSGLQLNTRIRLLSIQGQEMTKAFTLNSTLELDMSGYARGTYLLQVISTDGEIQTIKLVKQ